MHALFWLKTPIHPNEMYDVICAELPHAHEDPVLPSSWGLWRPQPKCTMHERRGRGEGKDGGQKGVWKNNTNSTFTTRDTNRQRWGIQCIEEGHERMAESEFSNFKFFVVVMSKLLQLLVTTLILMCLLLFFYYEQGTLTYPLHSCCPMLAGDTDRSRTGFGMVS